MRGFAERPAWAPQWDAYGIAHIDVDLSDGRATFRPGEPWALPAALAPFAWVITAYNPGARVLPAEENRRRHEELVAAVCAWVCWPAVGRDAEGGWQEASVAVVGAPERELLAIARRFEQDAVYRLAGEGVEIVPSGWGGRSR